MTETYKACKCMDSEDKKMILKIVGETIDRENTELRKISTKRMREMLKPPFVESFVGIRSSLVKVHEDFRKNIESLKSRIEEYPECSKIPQPPITDIGVNVRYPSASSGEIPVPFAKRKLF